MIGPRQVERSMSFRTQLHWLLAAGIAASAGAQTAGPDPVRAGLWQVELATTFDPDPQPGAANWPYMPIPRVRGYRICIDATRARSPMPPPSAPHIGVERQSDRVTARGEQRDASGGVSRVFAEYRQPSAERFEGVQQIESQPPGNRSTAMTMRHQYQAQWLQDDCGDLRPSSMGKFGTP
jgi:hypothetical protein